MQIAIRADSGSDIGSGHLLRCRALALALRKRGAAIDFLHARRDDFDKHLVGDFPCHLVKAETEAEDAASCRSWAARNRPDWLLVDHYGLSIEWQRQLREVVPRLMAIEDLANRPHQVDLLLDFTLRSDPELDYQGLLPADCRTLFGPHYALLRPEFSRLRDHCRIRERGVRRLLLSFGGADDTNLSGWALDALEGLELVEGIDLLVGSHHPDLAGLQRRCQRSDRRLHIQTEEVAELMRQADLAIGGGGMMGWERCTLGLPALIVVQSEDQQANAEALAQTGAAQIITTDDAEALRRMITTQTAESLSAMSQRAFKIVDGLGAQRVAALMLDTESNL
ncbi:UDP-2,4-diacetamido-2,4,6-trideoxy-beta-L-altropyranose hydrolase [endosymbiont of Ridgeia piscesae]|uniref:Pseudaminic acid biosynthesis-associated protein PseG n=1 Tax=endosymbiont of Ridgeia piscesae TaxID=54398 RepID=A0A0T5Z945_9GAMM|nr:UDP-2,4-diacetamido-2,4,6-trideoxy-beta-L-altropyranose hydrolase [endosymbiont of Ridgeia piscesae]KRT56384.1 pseudaminic acid biosynthesis-associated protein PseG [endosymbiont of Ridgeia piscesae]KRT59400.1 UDP-2,4-diacetamido-2,4,6-trideoxy-beta-L-altropyranose hydrolase [endosymbiont of Ridgeia piscesae]